MFAHSEPCIDPKSVILIRSLWLYYIVSVPVQLARPVSGDRPLRSSQAISI